VERTIAGVNLQIQIAKYPRAKVGSFRVQMKISKRLADRLLQHVLQGVRVVDAPPAVRLQRSLKRLQMLEKSRSSILTPLGQVAAFRSAFPSD
jgi:hypothetical protein